MCVCLSVPHSSSGVAGPRLLLAVGVRPQGGVPEAGDRHRRHPAGRAAKHPTGRADIRPTPREEEEEDGLGGGWLVLTDNGGGGGDGGVSGAPPGGVHALQLLPTEGRWGSGTDTTHHCSALSEEAGGSTWGCGWPGGATKLADGYGLACFLGGCGPSYGRCWACPPTGTRAASTGRQAASLPARVCEGGRHDGSCQCPACLCVPRSARAVSEPRQVLREFGLELPPDTSVKVGRWDTPPHTHTVPPPSNPPPTMTHPPSPAP